VKRLIFLAGLAMAGLATAAAHDLQGHFELKLAPSYGTHWLYGKRIGSDSNVKINCCTYGGHGSMIDCQPIHPDRVNDMGEDGMEIDGEFFKAGDITLSPDGKYYRCKHAGAASHCVFRPRLGV
jgi:hypothetical protein